MIRQPQGVVRTKLHEATVIRLAVGANIHRQGGPIGYDTSVILHPAVRDCNYIKNQSQNSGYFNLHRFSSFLQQYSTDGFAHAQNYKREI